MRDTLPSYAAALARVLADAGRLGTESVVLDEALGRVLAQELVAGWSLPPHDASAMDGYAVRAADTAGADPERPLALPVARRVYADGDPGQLGPGQASYVATGARLPAGADAVVRIELVETRGERVLLRAPVRPGHDVRRAGEDTVAGRCLVAAGTVIDPPTIAVLASFGHAMVEVVRQPRVAVLASGDELSPVASARPGAIVDSNSHTLAALVREAGGVPRRLGIVRDDPEVLAGAIAGALETAEVVLVAGGSSMGERDFSRAAFERVGVDVRFWGVAMRPGKPVGYRVRGGRLCFALPGNPGAAATAFEVLVRPALRALAGVAGASRPELTARLSAPVRSASGMTSFLRAHVTLGATGAVVTVPPQSAGHVTSALGSNALAILPAHGSPAPGNPLGVLLVGPPQPGAPPPTICFVGRSGAGKTTLLEKLIARLATAGLRVAALKHDAHRFQMDREGKDTDRLHRAGAVAIGIASHTARAIIADVGRPTPLGELVAALPGPLDLVLVEGYKHEAALKIEVHRHGLPRLDDAVRADTVAVVSDQPEADPARPWFHLDDVAGLCDFVRGLVPSLARGVQRGDP